MLPSCTVYQVPPIPRANISLHENNMRAKVKKPSIMEQFELRYERPKPNVFESIIRILKKILNHCLYCLTCGRYGKPATTSGSASSMSRCSSSVSCESSEFGWVLHDNEREAVKNLLHYLEDESTSNPVLDVNHIKALNILVFSDNMDLQRSAALCFSEVSQKTKVPITTEMARPLLGLLRSRDEQVLKGTTLAISNFAAAQSSRSSQSILLDAGALSLLLPLLEHESVDVQCNTTASITNLAVTEATKRAICQEGGAKYLLNLLQSRDERVQKNAGGALLNISQLSSNREDLVRVGVIPILVEHLDNRNKLVQLYSSGILGNLALDHRFRTFIMAVGPNAVVDILIRHLTSESERVRCQACQTLRNLSTDAENQSILVQYKIVPALHDCMKMSKREARAMSMACLRNVSVHRANQGSIVNPDTLSDLRECLLDYKSVEAQGFAMEVVRNLVAGSQAKEMFEHGFVKTLAQVILNMETKLSTLVSATSAVALFCHIDEAKQQMMSFMGGKLYVKLVTQATLSPNIDVQYNCANALCLLSEAERPTNLKEATLQGVVLYIDKFLKSWDRHFMHVALWTLTNLLKDQLYLDAFQEHGILPFVEKLVEESDQVAIHDLADKVSLMLLGFDTTTTETDDSISGLSSVNLTSD